MANSNNERNSVISNLRACLISSQGGIRMDSLNKDYMQIIGECIPYKRLGFNQLEEFLKSVPEISVKRRGGEVYIEAKESQTSAHVTKLVSKQKKSGRKKPKANRNIPPRYFRTAPRFTKRVYKAPLISSPQYNPQKQCYLPPLKISVPQNNNTINYNARIVSEVNRASNKTNYPMPVNHNYVGVMERPSLVSQFTPKNMKYIPPLLSDNSIKPDMTFRNEGLLSPKNLRYPPPLLSDNSIKPDMVFRNEAFITPSSNNLNSFKESVFNSPIDHSSYGSTPTPTPPEEPSKKIKQLAQDRLDKVKKHHKLLVTVSLQQGESTSPYQRQLSAYIQERGWEEAAYKILKENSGKRVCYCTLSILIPRMAPNLAPEVVDCGTFPNNFYDVNEAKECVAKQALEKLKKREIFNTFPIIQDPALILQRVERMVKEKDTGKWASRIEDEHRTLFKEILPPHWLDVVHASDQFIVEELANSSLLIKVKENAVPFPTVVDSTIPKLVLPEDNTWDVFVTRAVSVTEICIRFIGDDYSGLLDSLTSDMESWYQQKEHLVNPFLVVGEYYASYCNESWARVLVMKINIDDIHVKFIDHGDDDVLPRSVLYKLEPKFMSLPPQAITVSLKNLESYKNCKEAPDYLLTNIVGSCLVAVVEQRTPTISVTLFDTSQEEALNLNEKLKYLFNYNYKEKVNIEEDGIHQASVSFIDENGTVYIQFVSETINILLNQMEYIEDGTYEKYRVKDYSQLFPDKLYLLDQQNSEKHRVKIINATSLNGQVLVNFIDSGGEESVFVEDLYNLEEISYLLSQIPAQAVAVKLHEVTPEAFTPERMSRLKELLLGESVVAKIRKIEDGIPVVELFKRTVPENLMASINQTLILDSTLKNVVNKLEQFSFKSTPKTEKCVQKNILQQISNNFPSGSIERRIAENRPVLPEVGEEFQILVQQTANPSFIMVKVVKESSLVFIRAAFIDKNI
ncbi:unnamed protein product [Nezara viridula]|uniref:HTH OST-type domain-containing protein n=1 Tax=Nezara viridula TaxID=85310 RepID=A0A9P0HTA0_NEZVI|nr:unnamed protein product [Nezara viridula]